MSLIAIVREPSASLADCELSFVDRAPIDVATARSQHAAYREALRSAGAQVLVLPALDHLPDAAFVEDTAVVLDEVAVLGALGVASRSPEPAAVADALAAHRRVLRLDRAGATLEGGDVLRVGRTLYVGRSARTNEAGIEALRSIVEPLGYRVREVAVERCLHLKTACSAAGADVVVYNPDWVSGRVFEEDGLTGIPVAASEPWAANVLLVTDTLLVPAGNGKTVRRLRSLGVETIAVQIGEFQKAEAGLTCLSLLLSTPPMQPRRVVLERAQRAIER